MGRNKDELIKLAEKITGQECKDVLTKKDALKKIACHYLGEEKEFASIADCLECIVEYGASGGSGGGGKTITKKLNAKEIRTSVESKQAITPPEGYDGFSEITFIEGFLSEQIVTENQTLEFGTDNTPYFPKKLTVSVPTASNYTLETLSLDKNSEPITISYADKVFVFLGKIESWGEFVGLGGTASNLLYSKSVTVEDAGATAGTVSIDPDAKTITYTPNTSYNMGSVRITKLII